MLKFKSVYTGSLLLTAAEVVDREALEAAPYAGEMERMRCEIDNLRKVVCVLVDLLPPDRQVEVVNRFVPSYWVEGTS
jgi:hypothetical protein